MAPDQDTLLLYAPRYDVNQQHGTAPPMQKYSCQSKRPIWKPCKALASHHGAHLSQSQPPRPSLAVTKRTMVRRCEGLRSKVFSPPLWFAMATPHPDRQYHVIHTPKPPLPLSPVLSSPLPSLHVFAFFRRLSQAWYMSIGGHPANAEATWPFPRRPSSNRR